MTQQISWAGWSRATAAAAVVGALALGAPARGGLTAAGEPAVGVVAPAPHARPAVVSPSAVGPTGPRETPRRSSGRDEADPAVADIVAGLNGLPFEEFLDASHRQLQLRDPDALMYNGSDGGLDLANDRFTDLSSSYLRQTEQLETAILCLLRGYDRGSLPEDRQLSYDVYEWSLDNLVRGHRFRHHDLLVSGYGSWDRVNRTVALMVDILPVDDERDAEDYIARLGRFGAFIDQVIEGVEGRAAAGNIPPRPLLDLAILYAEYHMQMLGPDDFDVDAIELFASFRDRVLAGAGIDEGRKPQLVSAARAAVEETVIPAFLRLRDELVAMEPLATDDLGVGRLPDGEAYYAYLLNRYTGAEVTVEEVRAMGSARVASLQARMREVAAALGYPPGLTMAEIDQVLAELGSTLEGEALLAEYERLLADAELAAEGFFNLRPTTPVVITYDASAPVGYYQPPPLDGSGPGAMVTNLQNPASVTLYNHTVLAHHEMVPGHHVQLALMLDLELPAFRNAINADLYYGKDVPLQGYVEGWAVYAQQLGQEMGLYGDDLVGELGLLRLLLHQAARMEVDAGINALGWTAEQAADFLTQTTGVPATATQMIRYAAVPAQAVGFNHGALTILELRQAARDRLGDGFDIRQFHDLILGSGPMPAGMLHLVVGD